VPLRLLSYLAPSLPAGLFEALTDHLARSLGTEIRLTFETRRSGPRAGERKAFDCGEVDVAFVCATSYVWLTDDPAPSIDLVGAAWAPTDPRSAGAAVYFADILTSRATIQGLGGLAGHRVAYNDEVSLSGFHSLLFALAAAGVEPDRVEMVASGSHLRSLDLLTAGAVDAAALDATVWRRQRRVHPELADLKTLAPLGPHPVQPVVTRAGLPADLRRAVREALLSAHQSPQVAAALADAELRRFVAIDDHDFAGLRAVLAAHDLQFTR